DDRVEAQKDIRMMEESLRASRELRERLDSQEATRNNREETTRKMPSSAGSLTLFKPSQSPEITLSRLAEPYSHDYFAVHFGF
ncbi:MAG: hypothetical protein AB7F64_04605, partial [Gammaproteobacteria bacterium]